MHRGASRLEVLRGLMLFLAFSSAVSSEVRAGSGGAENIERPRAESLSAELLSLTFHSRVLTSGPVTLSGGEYRAAAAPGSKSGVIARLTKQQAYSEWAGGPIAAVVVATSVGGSATFLELALVNHRAGVWENTDTMLLGDRVKVDSVAIENGVVTVGMTEQGPQDPLCCPTAVVRKRFAVRDDRLVQSVEAATAALPDITQGRWQWAQTRYRDDKQVVPEKPENFTIRFLENGTIDVRADCNRKGGTYSLTGNRLSIRITHSTMAACGPASLENRFVQDLAAGASCLLRDGELQIDLKDNAGTMKFLGR